MKLLTTLLIAALAALGVYAARRRVFFALRTGAIVYIIVLFGRLLLSAGSLADRWEDVIWPVLGMLVIWAVAWFASNLYLERRERRGH
jgi:CHASE2 domain-containing sensor protein